MAIWTHILLWILQGRQGSRNGRLTIMFSPLRFYEKGPSIESTSMSWIRYSGCTTLLLRLASVTPCPHLTDIQRHTRLLLLRSLPSPLPSPPPSPLPSPPPSPLLRGVFPSSFRGQYRGSYMIHSRIPGLIRTFYSLKTLSTTRTSATHSWKDLMSSCFPALQCEEDVFSKAIYQ